MCSVFGIYVRVWAFLETVSVKYMGRSLARMRNNTLSNVGGSSTTLGKPSPILANNIHFSQPLSEVRVAGKRAGHWTGVRPQVHDRTYIQN